jgi:LPS-assembly protein
VNYLPNDSVTQRDRNRFQLDNVTELPRDVRFFIDAETVSDSRYFEDFAQGPEGTSVAFVERLAGFAFRDEHWRMSAEFQQFQTIDRDLVEIERPYARLPRVVVGADFGWGPDERLRYGFDSEVVNFDRSTGVTGWRFDAMPAASLDLGGPGMFLRPGLAFRYTEYSLEDTAPGQRTNPTRALPIASLDAGLIFERDSGSRAQRRLTLEPRLLYLNVPFREQNDLPLFDTGVPDLNLVQLFRTNRYVGADRVSDADQVSMGVTSRLFDAQNGAQFLAVTLGQTYYFQQPRVHLPDEPDRDSNSSDFVGQLSLTAYKNWNADFGIQWSPDQSRSERAQANIQFKPDGEQIINVGYRFQRDRLEQTELSSAWPIGQKWNAFARYVYSLRDDKALERFAGLEYRACCWRMRVVGRKFVSSRTGEQDTGIYVQLELTGLASVGSAGDAFVTGAIRGYERPDITR